MDIEQLKLVLETFATLGHEAASFAKLWLWLKFGGGVLQALLWIGAVISVVFLITRLIYRMEHGSQEEQFLREHGSQEEQFLREMRGILGTGTRGALTDTERERTISLLRTLAIEHANANRNRSE